MLEVGKAELGWTFSMIRQFMQAWVYRPPLQNPWRTFKDARSGDSTFKAQASDMLSLYGVVRVLVARNWPAAVAPQKKASFLAMCGVLDSFRRALRTSKIPSNFAQSIITYLRAHSAAYGTQDLPPKFHYALHNAEQFGELGQIFTTFVHERKHRGVKATASNCTRLGVFEQVVVQNLLIDQARAEIKLGTFFEGGSRDVTVAPGQYMEAINREIERETEINNVASHAFSLGRESFVVSCFCSRELASILNAGLMAKIGRHLNHKGLHIAVGHFVSYGNDEIGKVASILEMAGEYALIVNKHEKALEEPLQVARAGANAILIQLAIVRTVFDAYVETMNRVLLYAN